MASNPQEPYKGPINQPCSACSAGDTAMEHHDHDYVKPENRHAASPLPAEPPPTLAQQIQLELETLERWDSGGVVRSVCNRIRRLLAATPLAAEPQKEE